MTLDYGSVIRAALGNNPNPYMRLNVPNGIRNELTRLGNRIDNWAWNNLPRANGMQDVMFQEWYPDDSKAKYDLMMKYYNY